MESENGHDTKLVPEGKVVDEVNKQVSDGKWATVEIIPDDHYSGEPKWKLVGTRNNRVIELKTVKG